MKISDYCIKNKVISYAFIIILLALGVACFFKLSVKVVPRFHSKTIYVNSHYQGASPQFMQNAVTAKIEDALHRVDGIDTVFSYSSMGSSQLEVDLQPNQDINQVALQIQNEISMIRNKLPRNASTPHVQIDNESGSNILMFVGLYGNGVKLPLLTNYAETHIMTKFNSIPGVGQTEDGYNSMNIDPAIRIWLQPKKMALYGVTTNQVMDQLNRNNVETSGGRIETANSAFSVAISTKPKNLTQIKNIIIKRISKDNVVHLGDVASVKMGADDITDVGLINGKPGIMMTIFPQQKANNLKVAEKLRRAVSQMQHNLPSGMHLKILIDRSRYINDATTEVYKAIIIAVILVSIVVFLFLGSLRLFIIPIIIVPICLISGFAILSAFGFTINIMTLLAIVLSIGLVVDDAIVVLENVMRHFHRVKDRVLAAESGVREIAFPIIAMTCTLVVVYLPIVFLPGFLGDLIRPFAYTLAALVVLSGVLSLTLTPTMCSQLINQKSMNNRYIQWLDAKLERLNKAYERLLARVLKWRFAVIAFCLLFIAAGGYCFTLLHQELLPSEDYGVFGSVVHFPSNTSPIQAKAAVKRITSTYQSIPGVAYANGLNYFQNNLAFFMTFLKSPSERTAGTDEIMKKAQALIQQRDPTNQVVNFPYPLFSSANSQGTVSFALLADMDYQKLGKIADNFVNALKSVPGILHPRSLLQFNASQIQLDINRHAAMDLGVPLPAISSAISTLYGAQETDNDFTENGTDYPIMVMLPALDRGNLSELDHLFVQSETTQTNYPLSRFVIVKSVPMSSALTRMNYLPATQIFAGLAPGYAIGDVLNKVKALARDKLPPKVQFSWTEDSKQYIEASGGMTLLIVMALIAIFIVLTLQFKSFTDPFIILLTVPLTFIGAILTLYFSGGTLNVYTKVGLLTLIGLITKHGILITDFANELLEKGLSKQQAIIQAAGMRLRPILMTTLAMILGSLPLALSYGEGSHAIREIGWVLVGGLFCGTCFSLFVVPIAFLYLGRKASVT